MADSVELLAELATLRERCWCARLESTPMTTETCRDVLAELLAAASNMSDLADQLDGYGYPVDRIHAAIAADDAELTRLRRIEDAARAVDDTHVAILRADPRRRDYGAIQVGHARAHGALSVALLPPGNFMRQLDAAQRIAGEMPELRRRHARMAVDGGRDDG